MASLAPESLILGQGNGCAGSSPKIERKLLTVTESRGFASSLRAAFSAIRQA